MRFCQFCCNQIGNNERFYETWCPEHQYLCIACHEKRKAKKEGGE